MNSIVDIKGKSRHRKRCCYSLAALCAIAVLVIATCSNIAFPDAYTLTSMFTKVRQTPPMYGKVFSVALSPQDSQEPAVTRGTDAWYASKHCVLVDVRPMPKMSGLFGPSVVTYDHRLNVLNGSLSNISIRNERQMRVELLRILTAEERVDNTWGKLFVAGDGISDTYSFLGLILDATCLAAVAVSMTALIAGIKFGYREKRINQYMLNPGRRCPICGYETEWMETSGTEKNVCPECGTRGV